MSTTLKMPAAGNTASTAPTVQSTAKVYNDHLAILRSIQAPPEVIKIAEQVSAEVLSGGKK